MPTTDKCICKDELMMKIEQVVCHLSWCPDSYFYKEAVEEYVRASWFRRLFLRDPRKYHNFLLS